MIAKLLAAGAFVAVTAAVPPPINVPEVSTVAALFGGVLLAMSTANAVLFGPTPATQREKFKAAYDVACSMIAAGIAGWFIAPAICFYLHQQQVEVVSFLGLCIGSFFWKFAPTMIEILTTGAAKLTRSKIEKLS